MEAEATQPHRPIHPPGATDHRGHAALVITCFLIIATYVLLCDLKGVNTDEGLRLGIINGGQPFRHDTPPVPWEDVLQTGKPFAYQPLYFLLQRTVMNVAQSHSEVLLKLVNIGFLWLSLQGLLALSVTWRLLPRLFLLGAFSFNAYLLMHVLQIREYILGVTFYIWSSWLVLQLLERKLQRIWWDTAWFTAYGLLLILGFYVQTWVVFVAAAQGLFLVVRRHRDRWRFHAHLALSYLMVVAATLPFLRANHQRVDVGRWGTEGTDLWPQLSNGFHLVLTGHIAGHAAFTEFLFWLWPVFIAAAAIIMMVMARPADPTTADARSAFWHQGLLMILSMTFPFAFQVVYFFRLDNLSVWPRYFVIHYFFVFWLLALAVRYLHALASSGELSLKCRRPLQALVVTAMAMMLGAGVYQTASYYRAPFFDTSLSPTSNWRRLAVEISRVLRPDDVMVVHELINQSSLTFSRPLPNRVLMLTDLERADLDSSKRLVYLESVSSLPQRDALAARMAALGYIHLQEVRLHAPDGQHFIPDWRLLVFQR